MWSDVYTNKQTYKPYTLVGPTVTRPVQDPLAVLLLDNQLHTTKICVIFQQMTLPGHGADP